MSTKYSTEIPPVYERCAEKFGVSWDRGIIIAYGDTIHSIFGDTISEDLKVHERTHLLQQSFVGVEEWWERYFEDPDFRRDQETEAYRNQYAYAQANYNSAYRKRLLKHMADSMSRIYDRMCTYEEAVALITG